MGRASLVLVAAVLLGCGKKSEPEKKQPVVRFLQVRMVAGQTRVLIGVADQDGSPVIVDGVAEVVVTAAGNELCRGRWEVHGTTPTWDLEFLDITCAEQDVSGRRLSASLTFTWTDGETSMATDDSASIAGDQPAAAAPVDAAPAADVTPYLERLATIAAATGEQRDGSSHCEGALSRALDPKATVPYWLVEHDRIGALLGTGATPPSEFAWVSNPNFHSVDALARSLAKPPPVLLVATASARTMPVFIEAAQDNQKGRFEGGVYEGTLYAVDHETGAVACHIHPSVRSSQQVEGRDEMEADFKGKFGEALYQARGRLSDPMWFDDDPPPEY